MLVQLQNIKGGPKIKSDSFPIMEERGVLGFRIGYIGRCSHCGRGDGEPVLIRTIDAERIANRFASNLDAHKSFLEKLKYKPEVPFKQRLFIWLFGKKVYREFREEFEDEIED